MKERTKQKLKMFTSLFFCAASLFSCVGLTLAWFAFNDNVSGNGIGVGAEKKSDLLGYEFFAEKKDADTAERKFVAVDKTAAEMGVYDLVEDDYRLLLKVYLKESVASLTVKAVTETTAFLGNEQNGLKLNPAKGENPLSSVVAMRTATLKTDAAAGEFAEDGAGVYTWTTPAKETYQTMIDANNQVISAAVCTGYTEFYADSYENENGETVACKAAYILFSYDADLITKVFSANIGNEEIENAETAATVPFLCDFYMSLQTTSD